MNEVQHNVLLRSVGSLGVLGLIYGAGLLFGLSSGASLLVGVVLGLLAWNAATEV